jgi:hypothetical protein
VGVRPLRAALAHLIQTVAADAVVQVDGGVDVILKGDETSVGTPAEDLPPSVPLGADTRGGDRPRRVPYRRH